MSNHWK